MKYLLALLLVLFTTTSYAAIPFTNEAETRFAAVEAGSSIATGGITSAKIADDSVTTSDIQAMGATSGHFVKRVAKIVYDPSGVAADRTVAAHASGVTIPANAIITKSFFFTKTAVTSTSNDGTIAISCNAANDIFSAADIDASSGVAGAMGDGIQTGVDVSKMLKVTTACDITFTVAVHALLTGKIDLYIEYVIAE